MVHPSAAPSQTSAVYPTETQAHSHSAPLSTTSSVAVGSGTATISFTGDSGAELSTAEAEALLDSLRYNNSSDNPTASSDRVLSINAFDGAAQTSNTATSTITVAAANDAPTLDLDPGQASNNYSFTFTEGDSATAITVASGTSLADVDSSSFDKVTVAFSQANFADGASESLNINGASLGGTISNLGGLSNGDTGTFTLSSVVYDFSVAVGSGTATISFTGDSGAELSTAEAEALLDSLPVQQLLRQSHCIQRPRSLHQRLRWGRSNLQHSHIHHHRRCRKRRSHSRSRPRTSLQQLLLHIHRRRFRNGHHRRLGNLTR